MKWFEKLFGESEATKNAKTLVEAVSQLKKEKAEAEAAKEKAEAEALLLRDAKAAEDALRASNDPWVTIKGYSFDEKFGLKIELDWNEAFVLYLKQSGIHGKDDEVIVQKWLAGMYLDLEEKLSERVDDNVPVQMSVKDFE